MDKLLNFDMAIEPLSSGYRARVITSPAGEAAADFALPFTDKTWKSSSLGLSGRSAGFVARSGGSDR
jgi:hypothetical protein